MKNFVKNGEVLTALAPYAVNTGDGALIGGLFGVAAATYANGAEGEFVMVGEFEITALNTDTGSVGAKMYWDNTNKRLTASAAGNSFIGALTKAKVNGDTVARVRLNGIAV